MSLRRWKNRHRALGRICWRAGAIGGLRTKGETNIDTGTSLHNTGPQLWRAPIVWSGLIVSASWAFGPLERYFLVLVADSPRRCAA